MQQNGTHTPNTTPTATAGAASVEQRNWASPTLLLLWMFLPISLTFSCILCAETHATACVLVVVCVRSFKISPRKTHTHTHAVPFFPDDTTHICCCSPLWFFPFPIDKCSYCQNNKNACGSLTMSKTWANKTKNRRMNKWKLFVCFICVVIEIWYAVIFWSLPTHAQPTNMREREREWETGFSCSTLHRSHRLHNLSSCHREIRCAKNRRTCFCCCNFVCRLLINR